ncbi:HAD family hydrolase [Pelotalea chapellei]|uniref:Hydrolase n=1 Tax=Pelotalea chapellei TaxID=44671 RepID=A0ABS5U7W6_9BACT|nr:hypothetical protein [Pelotalea chapellei]MBT1071751.1 hypothetical protein [Pelotalea chapellei]
MKQPLLDSQVIKAVSFDVFDTVFTRNVYHPSDLFLRLQKKLAGNRQFSSNIRESFHKVRMEAEEEARKRLSGSEEVTLGQIGVVLAESMSLSSEELSALHQEELDEELHSLSAIAAIGTLIKQLRYAGCKIVFVSDMYLPDDVVKRMLRKVNMFEPEDCLYVSGSLGKKKATGSLFNHVLHDLNIQQNQMIHFGDYLWSDYLIPRWKCGIRSIPVRIARNNRYERLLGETCQCLYCSSIAGASRAGRVALGRADNSVHSALNTIGCNVIGPIVVGFMLWTLQQAVQDGIKRLYFLSRDGDILLEVARELVKRYGISVDLQYLYVSRTAVFPALLGKATAVSSLTWLKEDNVILTPRIIADRLKLNVLHLLDELKRAGIVLDGPDMQVSKVLLDRICAALISDDVLHQMLCDSGRHAFSSLHAYLQQAGLFDGTRFALVDLGWHGSIQDAIHDCFGDQLGSDGISGFYFGVDRPGSPANGKYGFVFNQDDNPDVTKFQHLFRLLMEILCSGREGMVHGYRLNALGQFEPVFGVPEHPLNCERVESIRCGVGSFLSCLDLPDGYRIDLKHVKPQIVNVLKMLFFFPAREESDAIGDFRFSADQAGHAVHCVAQPFTLLSALTYLTKNSYAGRSTVSSWFFASWIRSSCTVRILLLPLVSILRLYYLRTGIFRFAKMKIWDSVNSCIDGIKMPLR